MNRSELARIARKHGTPVVVIDHEVIRRNYASFKRHLPKVQAYYAVKANPAPEIVRTLYRAGASFDVASLPEFMLVYENMRRLSARARQDFVWDKIVYANPIKPEETLRALDRYSPLVTYDNRAELAKIKAHAPHAGVVLRLRVPNTGSMVELSSKFGCDPGEAVDLVDEAFRIGLVVEGLSFHVGSQCTNFENFVQALNMAAAVPERGAQPAATTSRSSTSAAAFPWPTTATSSPSAPSRARSTPRSTGSSPPTSRSWPSPAASWWPRPPRRWPGSSARRSATASPATTSTTASTTRSPGIIFDHCQYRVKAFKRGATEISAVFGQTCDGLDTISRSESLPALEIGDLVYSENIGAYSNASSTWFNGFPPAKVVHVNQ